MLQTAPQMTPEQRDQQVKIWNLHKTECYLENHLKDLEYPEADRVRDHIYLAIEEAKKARRRLEAR